MDDLNRNTHRRVHSLIHPFYLLPSTGVQLLPNLNSKSRISKSITIASMSRSVSYVPSLTTTYPTTTFYSTKPAIVLIATPTMNISPSYTRPVSDSNNQNNIPLNDSSSQEVKKKNMLWIAPLVGTLTVIIFMIIGMIFYIRRNKRLNREIRNIPGPRHNKHKQPPPEESDVDKHSSWTSFSTVTPSTDYNSDKLIEITTTTLPPIYSQNVTSEKEKRLTSNTLVEKSTFSYGMLNKQYSPQLALSPSLAPSEFQQQFSYPELSKDLMHQRNDYVSMDNLDSFVNDTPKEVSNAYINDRIKPRINIYVPKMNLLNDFDNPFQSYSYYGDKGECDTYSHPVVNNFKN